MLGCGLGDLPLKYLGLPLGPSFKLKAMWMVLEDLIRDGWLLGNDRIFPRGLGSP